jgi:hypothetical protein
MMFALTFLEARVLALELEHTLGHYPKDLREGIVRVGFDPASAYRIGWQRRLQRSLRLGRARRGARA